MTVTVSPWAAWAVLSLALFGAWFLATRAWRWARDGVRDLREWWQDWRNGEDAGEDDDFYVSDDCGLGNHFACEGCWCPCGHGLEELPPERTQEDLGFTAPGARIGAPRSHAPISLSFLERLEARRERLAGAAELEHRAAYEAMGFDYPSGLMARVREAAP